MSAWSERAMAAMSFKREPSQAGPAPLRLARQTADVPRCFDAQPGVNTMIDHVNAQEA
jgi:hypothetical protein